MRHAQKLLLDAITTYGKVNGEIVKVDTFLNHRVDPALLEEIGKDIAGHFADSGIDVVLTAETSGILAAMPAARHLGVPMIFAKKKKPITMGECHHASSYSFTKQEETNLYVSKEVLPEGANVLFVDDFFAKGATFAAMGKLCGDAKCTLAGCAVVIDKSGRDDVYSILTLAEITGNVSPA